MSRLPTTCPACEATLEVTRLTCPTCAMHLEGRFDLPALLRLGREDLEFVTDFVRCSGSLKDLGRLRGQSYPTVRNRLNEILARLAGKQTDTGAERRKILEALARGELSVKDAVKRLEGLEP